MENFFHGTRQAGEQASRQVDFSPQTDTFHSFWLSSYLNDVCCTFHLGKMFIRFVSIIFDIY